MAREKTSQAKIVSYRLNPIHSEQKRVLEIIETKRKQDISLEYFVSAMLRAENIDPVIFNHEQQIADDRLASLVATAVKEALADIKLKPEIVDRNDVNGELTDYAKNFGQGFAARMRHSKGE